MGVGVACVGALALGLLGPLVDTAFLDSRRGGGRRHCRRASAQSARSALAVDDHRRRGRRVSRGRRCPRGVRHPRRSLRRSFARAGSHHVVGLRDSRHRRPRPGERPPPGSPRIDGLLDGAIAALAAMALAWIYLVNPALFHYEAPLPVRLLLSCYPPLSVFLVAMIARIAFNTGNRRPCVLPPPRGEDGDARRRRRLHASSRPRS